MMERICGSKPMSSIRSAWPGKTAEMLPMLVMQTDVHDVDFDDDEDASEEHDDDDHHDHDIG